MIDLATIKRKKVSGKATQGQKKNGLLHNKIIWIVSSIALVLIIAASITIPLVISNMQTTEEKVDYVGKEYSYKEEKVTFTKMSYEGVLMHSNSNDYDEGTYIKHIFFAAFDFSSFYPDKSIDDGKSKDDSSVTFYYNEDQDLALQALVEIQYHINKYNEDIKNDADTSNDNDIAVLYLIDLSKGNNNKVITSGSFGGSSDSTNSFSFGYIAGEDGFKKSYEYDYDSKNDPKSWDIFFTDFRQLRTDSRHVIEFITGTPKHDPFQLELA
jgi:hypothetical protein